MSTFFKVKHLSKKSKARLGEIHTAHGVIQTPAFVPVATKATLKGMLPSLISETGTQVAFVNTYHLVTHPGPDIIEKAGGVHTYARLPIPLMSDSAGFQVFSLAQKNAIPDSHTRRANIHGEEEPLVLKINENGVTFRSTFDGSVIEFTPEKSIHYQRQIGADLIMAFDECTYYPATEKYAEKAMQRTHEWLKRCIKYFRDANLHENKHKQYLYGIIQGGTFEKLRKQSAEFIALQDIDGVAIGGVSVGETKKEMREQVNWVSSYLPKDKPVHLLGIGHVDDILDCVVHGIDTFDCVEATRMARMGKLYKIMNEELRITNFEEIDITSNKFKADMTHVIDECSCYTCQNFTKSYLHHLFKQKELLAYTLATYHNIYTMNQFMSFVRQMIGENTI